MLGSAVTQDEPQTGARGRGRPRAFDRDVALAKAMHLFWRKGFEATSISDLTQAMAIGSPSLYAAFGSKEALYAEAVRHYVDTHQTHVWPAFEAAATVRMAVETYLLTLAAALTGSLYDSPPGCMVTLSAVGCEGHDALGELVRSERRVAFDKVRERIDVAIAGGEMPAGTDGDALARFVQAVQSGMSILARDGVGRAELEAVTAVAMAGWDARMVKGAGIG